VNEEELDVTDGKLLAASILTQYSKKYNDILKRK
jgi:hypothetical protein